MTETEQRSVAGITRWLGLSGRPFHVFRLFRVLKAGTRLPELLTVIPRSLF
jgi:hypothetical protein